MNRQKLIDLLTAVVGAGAVLMGVCFLFFTEGAANASGIAVIVVSLASGLILLNPLSLWGLVGGICMLVFSPVVTGIIMISAGMVILAVTAVSYLRKSKS